MTQTVSRVARKSIATVALSGTLVEKLEAAANAGFDGVEIMESDLLTFGGRPEEVRGICDNLGLRVEIYQPFRDFEAMPEPMRARNLDRAERKFDVMQALGTDLLLVCSNTQAATIDDPARAAADLAEMAARAARRGLRVGYEALSWGRHVSRWRQAWAIVACAAHPALGLILDSFHTLALGDDLSGIEAVPAEKLLFVQLADAPRLIMDPLSWSRHFRNFPGQGELDVAGFLRAVLDAGYAGPLSLEVFNDDFRAAPASFTARDGLSALLLVEAEAGYGAGLPAPPGLRRVEFLEFAVDPTSGEALAAYLGRLGFVHAGRHRSKDVQLYRQGGVELILNAEQDSAAAEHFQQHGPSICAMAVRVDDVARTLARAQTLLCPAWEEPIGPGEQPLPGIRAPDGSLVHLVEATDDAPSPWHADFEMLPVDAPAEGLRGIDHVVQALPVGRMPSFTLFWRAVFGLRPQASLDTADPYGLVHSRAMLSPDGRVRMVLNASDSVATATGRVVSTYAGAGVHHVALASADIVTTIERMRIRNAPVLTMPDNYYEDLSARWGFDDETLDAMQRRALLFDRDEGGEFRHVYLDAFAGRFYFEIVERRGAYAGFGAANAPIRAAVQAGQRASAGDPF